MREFKKVEPPEFSLQVGESIPQEFIFYTQDGQADFSSYSDLEILLDIQGIYNIEWESPSNPLTVSIDSDKVDKEGIHKGVFTLSWGSNRRETLSISLIITDPLSNLTLEDIRSELWDIADENDMHEGLVFEDKILMEAKAKTLDIYNGAVSTPSIKTFKTFPTKHIAEWRLAAAGQAMLLRANQLAHNMMPYQAEGLTVQDKEHRMQVYKEEGRERLQRWRLFIENRNRVDVLKYGGGRIG